MAMRKKNIIKQISDSLAKEIARDVDETVMFECLKDQYEYPAIITLQTNNIWDIDSRMEEIKEIKEWIDSLVYWHENEYIWRLELSASRIHVWFKDEKKATMCRLKYS